MKGFYSGIVNLGNSLQPVLLLAMRLYWGAMFALAGWGKLHAIHKISEYFATLNIPLPTVNAYFVGGIEFGCGLCLLLGLSARLASIPLIAVMTVALLTAHFDAVAGAFKDPQNLIEQLPFNYLLTSLIVLAFGPGAISLDSLFQKLFSGSSKK